MVVGGVYTYMEREKMHINVFKNPGHLDLAKSVFLAFRIQIDGFFTRTGLTDEQAFTTAGPIASNNLNVH